MGLIIEVLLTEFDRDEARKFLQRFKELVRKRNLYFLDREKFCQTLISLGLTKRHCIEEILNLSVLNYSSGPDPDFNKSGSVWIFGKVVDSHEIYIKIKIVETKDCEKALCLSFHIAEKPLYHPFTE
jgi:hypothetical protein